MAFQPLVCSCSECTNLVDIQPSNSLVHPARLLTRLEPAILLLNNPSIQDNLKQFHGVKCRHAKDKLASEIINISIEYCTNVSEMTLSGESLLIFKYHFNEKNVIIQFSNSQLHFILQKEITLTPGEIHGIGVSFVSNLQVLPEVSSELQDSLALAPEILFKP